MLCAVASLLVAGVWFLYPQLPTANALLQIKMFPLLILLTANDGSSRTLVLQQTALYSLTAATMILAALLVLRLGWAGLRRPSARYLARALGFGNYAIGYFFFVRELPFWHVLLPASTWWLDAAATAALAYSLIALVACFKIYPEPVTVDRVDRAFVARKAQDDAAADRIRAGTGLWRAWSWLPSEAYGDYGARTHPGREGLRRLCGSRELLWAIVLVAIVALGMAWSRQLADIGAGARLLFWCFAAVFVLFCLDPVLWARALSAGTVDGSLRRTTGRVAALELALHRLLGSGPGLLLVAAVAVVLTWMWNGKFESVAEVARWLWALLFMLGSGVLLFGHAMNLLYLNWRHGLGEHRRAIGWIFLATAGTIVLWTTMYLMLGLVVVFSWMSGPNAGLGTGFWSLGGVFRLGPPLVALALVVSLWVSILQRGSFDPGMALRRTTVYSLVAVLLTTLFVGLEGVASASIISGLGLSPRGGALIAGSAVALAFNPIRNRVENGVERLVDRLRPANLLADGKRYVAAVMFSDLVGYTALSGSDERAALTTAALFHKEARRAAEMHGGRLVKTIGDASLMVFPDSVAALSALTRVAEKLRVGAELLELETLPIHSGIHFGEIIEAPDGDIFGATVNIAARLEGAAKADQAVLSEAAATKAREAGFELSPIGPLVLKNVAMPIQCSVWATALTLTGSARATRKS